MKRKTLSVLLFLVMMLSACAVPASAAVVTQQDMNIPKLEVVSLTPRCSQGPKESHEIPSGTASWSWIPDPGKPDQSVGIAIDAIAPWMWDGTPTVPAGLAQLKWSTAPDEVHISSCEVKDYKNSFPDLVDEPTLDRPYIMNLKANRYYIITAHWHESHLKSDGGCGTVDYSFRT